MSRPAPAHAALTATALLGLLLPAAGAPLDPGLGVLQHHTTLFSTADGLPNQIVVALEPSRNGGLWVGTEGGLAWFDGRHFEVFDGRRDSNLASDVLAYRGLAEDAAGDLWLANLAGDLLRLDGRDRRVTLVRPSTGEDPRGVWFAGGAIWLGTSRSLVELRDGKERVLRAAEGLPEGGVRAVAADGAGRVFVSTDRGLRLVQGGRLAAPDPTVEAATGTQHLGALAPASDGGLWIAGYGLLLRTDAQGRLAARYGADAGLPREAPLVGRTDASGALWLGYGAGLARFHDGRLEGPHGARSRLGGEHVSSIAADREGNLWVGLWTGGLLRLREAPARTFGQEEGLTALGVNAVAEAPDGTIYLGTKAGLERLRGDLVELVAPAATPDAACTAIAFDAAGAPLFGLGRLLYRLEGGKPRRIALTETWILALAHDQEGTLWAGTEEGIRILRGGALVRPDGPAAPLADEAVAHLVRAPDGALWAVGERSGPYRRTAGGFVPAAPAPLPAGSMYEGCTPTPTARSGWGPPAPGSGACGAGRGPASRWPRGSPSAPSTASWTTGAARCGSPGTAASARWPAPSSRPWRLASGPR